MNRLSMQNITFKTMQREKGNTISAVKKDESADLLVCSVVQKTFFRMKRDKAVQYAPIHVL